MLHQRMQSQLAALLAQCQQAGAAAPTVQPMTMSTAEVGAVLDSVPDTGGSFLHS